MGRTLPVLLQDAAAGEDGECGRGPPAGLPQLGRALAARQRPTAAPARGAQRTRVKRATAVTLTFSPVRRSSDTPPGKRRRLADCRLFCRGANPKQGRSGPMLEPEALRSCCCFNYLLLQ